MAKYRRKLSEIIDEKIDLEIRDAQIKVLWDYMKAHMEDWTYADRISHLCNEYYLSDSAIEKIINDKE